MALEQDEVTNLMSKFEDEIFVNEKDDVLMVVKDNYVNISDSDFYYYRDLVSCFDTMKLNELSEYDYCIGNEEETSLIWLKLDENGEIECIRIAVPDFEEVIDLTRADDKRILNKEAVYALINGNYESSIYFPGLGDEPPMVVEDYLDIANNISFKRYIDGQERVNRRYEGDILENGYRFNDGTFMALTLSDENELLGLVIEIGDENEVLRLELDGTAYSSWGEWYWKAYSGYINGEDKNAFSYLSLSYMGISIDDVLTAIKANEMVRLNEEEKCYTVSDASDDLWKINYEAPLEGSYPLKIVSISNKEKTYDRTGFILYMNNASNDIKVSIENKAAELIALIASDDEFERLKKGEDFRTWINAKLVNELDGETESIAKQKIPAGFSVGCGIELELIKRIGYDEIQKIDEVLNDNIIVKMVIPKELRKEGRQFKIVRFHNDETTVLDTVFGTDDSLAFETDRFSTYVLVYRDSSTERHDYKKPSVNTSTKA